MSAEDGLPAHILRASDGRIVYMEATSEVVEGLIALLQAPLHDILSVSCDKGRGTSTMHNVLSSIEALRDPLFVSDRPALGSRVVGKATQAINKMAVQAESTPPRQTRTEDKCTHLHRESRSSSGGRRGTWERRHQELLHIRRPSPCYCHTQDYDDKNDKDDEHADARATRPVVHGTAKFIVLNDLSIIESSSIASIALINAFGKPVAKLKPEQVMITQDVAVKIVSLALLNKKCVLDDAFPLVGQLD
mmetsp:Transcript_19649/g.61809  ORF Transcript_19649/g.61809 Transcript_19649/m.61809 type:complete len:248 (-) Transcript_19649:420-1163(-)